MSPRCPSKTSVAASVMLALSVAFAGCATKQLKSDFATISDAYAQNMNRQMLLNLARLDQGHPAYFMAIGEVRLQRSQSGGLSATGNSGRTDGSSIANTVTRTVSNVLGVNVTPSGTSNATPSFVFIPINSEEAARQLLSPIPIEAFNTLYQQGWPVDQLLRVLVERIEVSFDDGREPVVLTNSPARGSPASFARFLRMCEVVRELQRRGGLALDAEEKFIAQSRGDVTSVSARDALDAADKGRVWRKDSSGWALGTTRSAFRFRANKDVLEHVLAGFAHDTRYEGDDSLANLRAIFMASSGLAVGSQEGPVPQNHPGIHSVLVLRSFRNVLEAVAQEQQAFDELAAHDHLLALLPERQKRPILRTLWRGVKGPALQRPVVSLGFAGRDYAITDPVGDVTSIDSRWNRDVFRLLVNLSSQVTVDITKFQRQVLELTP